MDSPVKKLTVAIGKYYRAIGGGRCSELGGALGITLHQIQLSQALEWLWKVGGGGGHVPLEPPASVTYVGL